jgi:hypothetical protein
VVPRDRFPGGREALLERIRCVSGRSFGEQFGLLLAFLALLFSAHLGVVRVELDQCLGEVPISPRAGRRCA